MFRSSLFEVHLPKSLAFCLKNFAMPPSPPPSACMLVFGMNNVMHILCQAHLSSQASRTNNIHCVLGLSHFKNKTIHCVKHACMFEWGIKFQINEEAFSSLILMQSPVGHTMCLVYGQWQIQCVKHLWAPTILERKIVLKVVSVQDYWSWMKWDDFKINSWKENLIRGNIYNLHTV